MMIAVVYNKKKVHGFEFFFGSMISLGMVFFAAADFQVSPNFDFVGMPFLPLLIFKFHPISILLVCLYSVCNQIFLIELFDIVYCCYQCFLEVFDLF